MNKTVCLDIKQPARCYLHSCHGCHKDSQILASSVSHVLHAQGVSHVLCSPRAAQSLALVPGIMTTLPFPPSTPHPKLF